MSHHSPSQASIILLGFGISQENLPRVLAVLLLCLKGDIGTFLKLLGDDSPHLSSLTLLQNRKMPNTLSLARMDGFVLPDGGCMHFDHIQTAA